jgi:hypothetical protein
MALGLTTFWEAFFLLLIWIPLAMLWVGALFDIFRRDDMTGFTKALWVVCVILVPYLGALIYLITRPSGAIRAVSGADRRAAIDDESAPHVARFAPVDTASRLEALADLRDRGTLTDEEFAAEKAKVLGTAPPTEPPPSPAT